VHSIATIDLAILIIIYCKQTTIDNVEKLYNTLKQRYRTKKKSNSTIQLRQKQIYYRIVSTKCNKDNKYCINLKILDIQRKT